MGRHLRPDRVPEVGLVGVLPVPGLRAEQPRLEGEGAGEVGVVVRAPQPRDDRVVVVRVVPHHVELESEQTYFSMH